MIIKLFLGLNESISFINNNNMKKFQISEVIVHQVYISDEVTKITRNILEGVIPKDPCRSFIVCSTTLFLDSIDLLFNGYLQGL
jgi:hypothetical protein